jgi:hypothetical protein
MKTLSSLFLSLTCVFGMSSTVSATPIKGPVSIEALEVFETSPEDYTFVCARYQGESTTLVPGKIKGIDFYPVTKISIKRLQRKAKKARNEKLEQWFLRRAKKAQRKIKRCRQERRISPLVVEQYECGHDLFLEEQCLTSLNCSNTRSAVGVGSATTIAAAFQESKESCELYLATSIKIVEQLSARLTGSSITVGPTGGCELFGCGIVPKGMAWNVSLYDAVGTVVSCHANDCLEEAVTGHSVEPSWEEAQSVAYARCQSEMARVISERPFFDGYTTSETNVPCMLGLFDRKLSPKYTR